MQPLAELVGTLGPVQRSARDGNARQGNIGVRLPWPESGRTHDEATFRRAGRSGVLWTGPWSAWGTPGAQEVEKGSKTMTSTEHETHRSDRAHAQCRTSTGPHVADS